MYIHACMGFLFLSGLIVDNTATTFYIHHKIIIAFHNDSFIPTQLVAMAIVCGQLCTDFDKGSNKSNTTNIQNTS